MFWEMDRLNQCLVDCRHQRRCEAQKVWKDKSKTSCRRDRISLERNRCDIGRECFDKKALPITPNTSLPEVPDCISSGVFSAKCPGSRVQVGYLLVQTGKRIAGRERGACGP